jgi:predicted nucleotidyltransferase
MRSNAPALLPVLRSRHQAELLTWLYLHPGAEYSVTELAARLEVPLTTVHREVVRLDEAHLTTSRSQGRNRLVRADVSHAAARPLTQLLEITFGPPVVIEEEFDRLGADAVIVFGSWAARYAGETGPPPNDVDVLVVGNIDRTDLYDAADRATARLGLEVNPVLRSRSQWETRATDQLIREVLSGAYVTVIGTDDQGGHDGQVDEGRG